MGVISIIKGGIERKIDERYIDDFKAKGYKVIETGVQKKNASKSTSVKNV